jgi:methylenetetrahydrofolate reductase (NADPH)
VTNPFAAALASGRFVLTADIESPRHAGAAAVERLAGALAGLVDAAVCTDNSAAVARMSPVAVAAIAARYGVTPLIELNGRDRNRLALQSDLLGAAAVGAAGVVCLSGDPPTAGDHPDATPVYDLRSVELLRAVCRLSGGAFLSGAPIRVPPDLVPGAAVAPGDSDDAVARLAAKVEAGAAFVITQIGYDEERFAGWMARVRAAGLHTRVRILAGIAPVRRLAVARYLRERVPGADVPLTVLRRLEAAPDPEAEGVRLAAERLAAVQRTEGVAGAHIMTFGWAAGARRVLAVAAGEGFKR